MHALVVSALSPDFSGMSLEQVEQPSRRPGEILVRVCAASLNYPDLLMTRGEYQFKPDLPFVSGLEMAGEVIESDGTFAVGDRVMGGAKTGAFANYIALPASSVRHVPHGLSWEAAASLGAAYTTAWTALVELGALQPGQTVLVHGASGGVGLAACDLARALGARVIAATHQHEKVSRIMAAVGPAAIILNTGRFRDEIAALTDGNLCDLVFDPVGGDVFDESTRCVAFGGRLLVIGFAGGRIPQVAANIPLIKGFSIVGVRAGEYARRFPDRGARITAEVETMAARGDITPVIDRIIPLQLWREAFVAMAAGKIVGKVVIQPG